MAFEKSISKSAFLFLAFLGFGDPAPSAGTSGSTKEVCLWAQEKTETKWMTGDA